jgi:hypothetical protein
MVIGKPCQLIESPIGINKTGSIGKQSFNSVYTVNIFVLPAWILKNFSTANNRRITDSISTNIYF